MQISGDGECTEKYGSVFDKCLLYGGDCDSAAVQQIFVFYRNQEKACFKKHFRVK